jgi:hypothetical protein
MDPQDPYADPRLKNKVLEGCHQISKTFDIISHLVAKNKLNTEILPSLISQKTDILCVNVITQLKELKYYFFWQILFSCRNRYYFIAIVFFG